LGTPAHRVLSQGSTFGKIKIPGVCFQNICEKSTINGNLAKIMELEDPRVP
jgi:hypothetical protein